MKINIGAGTDIKPGWVNLDTRELPGIDCIADARKLPFDDESADEILAQDIIEHLPFADVEPTLREWVRVLKPGGTLTIRTPDFLKIFRATVTRRLSDREALDLVFGDQSEDAGGYLWGGHKSGFSIAGWKDLVTPLCSDVEVKHHEHEFNLYIRAAK